MATVVYESANRYALEARDFEHGEWSRLRCYDHLDEAKYEADDGSLYAFYRVVDIKGEGK